MQMTLRDYLLRDFEANDEEIIAVSMPDGVESISHADYTCFRELDNRVKLMLDDDKGLLTIEVLMPERLMAAQVAQAATAGPMPQPSGSSKNSRALPLMRKISLGAAPALSGVTSE
jgi:hypothetical protein